MSENSAVTETVDIDNLFTKPEALAILKITERSFDKYVAAGEIVCIAMPDGRGAVRRYPAKSLKAFIERYTVKVEK